MTTDTQSQEQGQELSKAFEPKTIESRWYPIWEQRGYFKHSGDTSKPAYCIQLPPPNVTGTLHMGHAFQQTLMDTLVRYHRMRGDNTNWVVGTDHAGIATQIVVERQLQADGKSRHDLGREAFIDRVWEWKQHSGSTITRQMRRLGTSANWTYADTEGHKGGYFTMDAKMSHAVVEVFNRLHEQGLIYRGRRLVNWDPVLKSAVSDLEVEMEERNGNMWHILYPFSDGEQDGGGELAGQKLKGMTIATTRPETMLGDGALCVHPDDERYRHLVGKYVDLPLCDRKIPIIADTFVDPAFGSGCVKITGAHDFNDYQAALRHNIPLVVIMDFDANMAGEAPAAYRGLNRYVARKKVLADLEAQGLLIKTVPHKHMVPLCGRTGEVVEPMLTDQWFVKMDGLAKRGLDAVATGEVKFYPDHWSATYNHWLSNIQDWCISRQLWWGHQIPAWYDEDGKVYVARDESEATKKAGGKKLTRDADVLDTWFSSALVPFSSLGWPEDTPDLKTFLPSSVLVTGNDIIFFWVARMIMMTLHFTEKVPFKDVYINAMVRDAEGQKMSKSKGNTLDPLDLIDGIELEPLVAKSTQGLMLAAHKEKAEKYIRKHFPQGIPAYGADALRFTFTSLAPLSLTLNFDLSRCEGYRNFCNKLWNATRFVLMNVEGKSDFERGIEECTHDCGPEGYLNFSQVDRWIVSQLQRTEAEVAQAFGEYRFDHASAAIYKFVWDEYCDWYVELAKVQLQTGTEAQQRATRRTLLRVLETMLRLAHPIIPFITEELWQKVAPLAGKTGETVTLQPYPVSQPEKIDAQAEEHVAQLKEQLTAIRNIRSERNVSPAAQVVAYFEPHDKGTSIADLSLHLKTLSKLSSLSSGKPGEDEVASTAVTSLGTWSILIPGQDKKSEAARVEKEIAQLEGEKNKAVSKLANPNFVDRAPAAVVEQEKSRIAEFTSKIQQLKIQLDKLKG
jgi:valyl-tRNA synthetase